MFADSWLRLSNKYNFREIQHMDAGRDKKIKYFIDTNDSVIIFWLEY